MTALRAEGCGRLTAAGCVEGLCRDRFLGLTGLMGRRVLKFDGPLARGLWYRPQGDEYKVSVTGLAFYVIWHEKHSADWFTAFASPFPAARDFPRKREQNNPCLAREQNNPCLA